MALFGFNGRDVGRIKAMLRWYETLKGGVDSPGRADRQQVIRRALVTTAITSASGTNNVNAGSGVGKIYQRDPTSGAYSIMQGPSGDVSAKIWNPFTGTVAVNKVVLVFRSGNDWELVSADCP